MYSCAVGEMVGMRDRGRGQFRNWKREWLNSWVGRYAIFGVMWLGNKRPKGPHIVHLSTMCHLFEESARAAILFLFFLIGSKNTNLVEDIEILLPVKFRSIQISSFRGEVENVSAIQRPGRPCCFSDWPEKHKLGRGRWDLASCQVSLNSNQRFQRRSW